MVYAQIKDGIVINTLVLLDKKLEPLFKEGFDFLIRIDNLSPQPGTEWTYGKAGFKPPKMDDVK